MQYATKTASYQLEFDREAYIVRDAHGVELAAFSWERDAREFCEDFERRIEMLAQALTTAKTVRGVIIDGVAVEHDERGWIYWSDNWAEVPRLCTAGLIRAAHGGPGTYSHTDYFVL